MEAQKEQDLRRMATKRVNFKRHLYTYLIINVFFWGIWLFALDEQKEEGLPWPLWSMLTWGIAVAFDYIDAYHSNRPDAIDRELEKIKRERE